MVQGAIIIATADTFCRDTNNEAARRFLRRMIVSDWNGCLTG
jgi:hypothetical protein